MKQQPIDGYLISEKTVCKYDAKKLTSFTNSRDKMILFTDDQMLVMRIQKPEKIYCSVKIQTDSMVSFATSLQTEICILYKNGCLEIRDLEKDSQIIYQHTQIESKPHKNFPQLCWEGKQIYLLGESALEVIDMCGRKKVHKGLIPKNQKDLFQLFIPIKIIQNEATVLFIYTNKLTFLCLPLPIAEYPISGVTGAQTLFCPQVFLEKHIPNSFLVLMIENKRLEVRNLLNMKIIAVIEYENPGKQTISITKDKSLQLLIVTFSTKKKKITRTIVYKINTKYYYKKENLFEENQNFFEFEVEVEQKQPIIAFPPTFAYLQKCRLMLIEMCYVKQNQKTGKGEINHFTLIINEDSISKQVTGIKYHQKQWQQDIKWKQSMMKCLDLLSSNKSNPIIYKQNLDIETPYLCEQSERELSDLSDDEIKKEEQYIAFVKQFCEDLSEEDQTKFLMSMKNKNLEELIFSFLNQQISNEESNLKDQSSKLKLGILNDQEASTVNAQQYEQRQEKKGQKKFHPPQFIQNLPKNLSNNSLLSLTKSRSSGNQDNLEELKARICMSSFSEGKDDEDWEQQLNSSDYICENQNEQFDSNILAISEAITNAFKPLQSKLDQINLRIKRSEQIHISQLQRCQRMVQRQQAQLQNMDMKIAGFCQEMVCQIDNNLQKGLDCYWNKIEEIDRKSSRNRAKVIADFGLFIDQQIKSREEIFNYNRSCIENNLNLMRKKMIHFNTDEQEEQDVPADHYESWTKKW